MHAVHVRRLVRAADHREGAHPGNLFKVSPAVQHVQRVRADQVVPPGVRLALRQLPQGVHRERGSLARDLDFAHEQALRALGGNARHVQPVALQRGVRLVRRIARRKQHHLIQLQQPLCRQCDLDVPVVHRIQRSAHDSNSHGDHPLSYDCRRAALRGPPTRPSLQLAQSA